MKFNIPEYCEIRWQAALAVLEDLQEDTGASFDQGQWADEDTIWQKTNGCGTAACFGGYISVSPYCKKLGYPKDDYGWSAAEWLTPVGVGCMNIYAQLFNWTLDQGSRAKTLAFLEHRIKKIFKDSTGKKLVAPLTFYY